VFIVSDSSMGNVEPIFHKDKEYKNLVTLFPQKKIKRSIGSFHPKIMLIKFEEHLRIVIGSGNLCSGDWHLWINSFITIDFKKKHINQKNLKKSSKLIKSKLKKKSSNIKFSNFSSSELDTDTDEGFNMRIFKHTQKLRDIGYNFKDYLKTYMCFILGKKFNYLNKFLDIDFDDFNLKQNEIYLVGSLPGAYNNHFNYSYPELIKEGTIIS
jgi:hypothetical protein